MTTLVSPDSIMRRASSTSRLLDRSLAVVPEEGETEAEYCHYCVSEILTAFEYAMEIKKEFSGDPILQKMLALDIPILQHFQRRILLF